MVSLGFSSIGPPSPCGEGHPEDFVQEELSLLSCYHGAQIFEVPNFCGAFSSWC